MPGRWDGARKEGTVVTRRNRLNDFITDEGLAPDGPVQLLCEDHVGTYLIPFPCRRTDGTWRNQATGEVITGTVIGWREIDDKPKRRALGISS
jgi:hypothetical protein